MLDFAAWPLAPDPWSDDPKLDENTGAVENEYLRNLTLPIRIHKDVLQVEACVLRLSDTLIILNTP